MKARVMTIVFFVFVAAVATDAQVTNPIRHTWIVTSCETWNCAATAFINANGDPNVIVLPSNHKERPWLVLRRVEEGSIFSPEDEPFACEVFDNLPTAVSGFSSLNGCHAPLIMNVAEGKAVVISLSQCASKRRAVR